MRFNSVRNLSFLLLTVLLVGAVGTNAEERARIPADVAFDPKKAKSESDRLAQFSADDAELIGHFKEREASLDAMCNANVVTPQECRESKELVASRIKNTRHAVATHKTLSLIFAFYHRLIVMNLDPRDELAARSLVDTVCAKTLGLPDQLGDSMDRIAEMTKQLSKSLPTKSKLPSVKGSFEFCQSELTALEKFLKNGKAGNPRLTLFFRKADIPLEMAKETLERAKKSAENTESTLRYQDAVRRGAA